MGESLLMEATEAESSLSASDPPPRNRLPRFLATTSKAYVQLQVFHSQSSPSSDRDDVRQSL